MAQVAWGWWMPDIPKQPVGPRVEAYNLHKSVGVAIFALMLVRLGWRLGHPPPPLALPAREARLARSVHALLYVAPVVQPLTGYLGSVFSGYPVKLFGVATPAWGWRDEGIKALMSAVHLASSFALLALVALHLAGALRHAFDGSRVLRRMLPGRPAGTLAGSRRNAV